MFHLVGIKLWEKIALVALIALKRCVDWFLVSIKIIRPIPLGPQIELQGLCRASVKEGLSSVGMREDLGGKGLFCSFGVGVKRSQDG